MKRTQIAVGNFTYAYFPFSDFLESMKRLEISKIELWAGEPHLYFSDWNYAQMKEFSGAIRKQHLKVCCVTPEQYLYPINIGSENPDMRKRSINYFKRAIDVAAELEAPKVLVASSHHYLEEDRRECYKRTVEALTELAHNACFKGVKIVFEPMPRKIDLIRSAAQMKEILDAVGFYEGIHAMMDLDISLRVKDTPGRFIETFGLSRFDHVHLNDGNPGGHVLPGEGVLPVAEALQELDRLGYVGDVSMEITNTSYYENPEGTIRKCLAYLEEQVGLE